MSRIITVPGADASGRGVAAVSLSTMDREVGRVSGAIHYIDPEVLFVNGAPPANGASAQAFRDRVRGRPIRSSPGGAPIVALETGVANSKLLFDVTTISECDLSAQDATYTPSWTAIMLMRPVPASIDGSTSTFLLRAMEGPTARFSVLVTTGSAPTLLMRDDTLGVGLAWSYGNRLAAGSPVVLGFSVDQATKTYSFYCNDGTIPVQTGTVANVGAYPGARWTFWGAKVASGSWRGRAGRTMIWNRALLPAEMKNLMQQWRDYYGVLV